MTGILEQMAASLERIERFMAKSHGIEEQVDQKHSPLGSRRHCAAVRRRRAEELGGAEKVGKRYLLTRAALAEELDRCSSRTPQNDVLPSGDDAYHRAMLIARNQGKKPKS